jgi:nucleoside-diphosphate-sugar epimerase
VKQPVPLLVAAGHEVHGMTRRESKKATRDQSVPVVVVGDGGAVWWCIHTEDAAEATAAARDHGSRGLYNVVDDDRAPVAEWLPALVQTLGAKQSMRVPRFVAPLFAGEVGAVMMTVRRGASNAKAGRDLAWRPEHPSWRQGFAAA